MFALLDASTIPYHAEIMLLFLLVCGHFYADYASDYIATLWTKDTHGCLAGVQKESSENVQSPTAA